MNLDQTKQKAESGCVASAVQLAEYYYSENPEEAIKWAKMAADENHVRGAYLTALCLQKQIRSWESVKQVEPEQIRAYYFWAEKAYTLFLNNGQGSEQLQKDQLRGLFEDAVFVRANRLYLRGDYRNASLLLRRGASHLCSLLMGLCLLEHYKRDRNAVEEDLMAACECLSVIGEIRFGTEIFGIDEERVYAFSALRYSKFRNKGLYPEGVKPNLKESYHMLRSVRKVIRNEELQKTLDREMAHYRKVFPGRYKYLE